MSRSTAYHPKRTAPNPKSALPHSLLLNPSRLVGRSSDGNPIIGSRPPAQFVPSHQAVVRRRTPSQCKVPKTLSKRGGQLLPLRVAAHFFVSFAPIPYSVFATHMAGTRCIKHFIQRRVPESLSRRGEPYFFFCMV